MSVDRAGFIGVGNMGSLMATRLLSAGVSLTICDPNPANIGPLRERGADVVATPREVADKAEIVFASLPSLSASREVALGGDGIARGGAIKIYVEMSTLGTDTIDEIAQRLLSQGIGVLDAPVSTPSGGVASAGKGGLTIMAAGAPDGFERARPMLAAIATNVFYLGAKPGYGQLAKMINNHIGTVSKVAAFEGVALGMKAGLDARALIDVINVSSGRNATTMDKFPSEILPRNFGDRATLGITFKDMEQFRAEASKHNVPLWIAPHLAKLFEEAAADGYMNRSSYHVFEYVEKRAGIRKTDER